MVIQVYQAARANICSAAVKRIIRVYLGKQLIQYFWLFRIHVDVCWGASDPQSEAAGRAIMIVADGNGTWPGTGQVWGKIRTPLQTVRIGYHMRKVHTAARSTCEEGRMLLLLIALHHAVLKAVQSPCHVNTGVSNSSILHHTPAIFTELQLKCPVLTPG